MWFEQSARSRPRRPSMKEQTSRPPIFLLLPFYGEEGKEKLDDTVKRILWIRDIFIKREEF